jgi:hypothetical protein
MASLNECIDALAQTIRTYATARVYDYVPSPAIADSVVMRPPSSENLSFSRGTIEYVVELLVIAGSMNEKGAQRWLNDQITGNGSSSIAGAIFEHPTLGTATTESTGAADATMTASTLGFRDYGLVSFDGGATQHWSAVIPVRILTEGNT